MRQVFVDYNRIGNARRFSVPLSVSEACDLSVGDTVEVVGDDVEPRTATVTALDGLDARLEFTAEPAHT